MKLSLSPADRLTFPVRRRFTSTGGGGGGGAVLRALVLWVVLPFTVLSVIASGIYVFTGETPLDLLDQITVVPRIDAPMPPRLGPESPTSSLIRPPAAATSDPGAAPPPTGEAAQPAPAAEPPKPAEPAPAAGAPKPAEGLPPSAAELEHGTAPTAAPQGRAVVTALPPPPGNEPLTPPGGDPLAPPSFAKLPGRSDLKALMAIAPLPELLKTSAAGTLPITAGGKEPRQAYARPYTAEQGTPRIAVVVVGLGISKEATDAAIAKLPPEVSLSFSPYAGNLDGWVKKARANGHEVLLDLPLEPPNFPVRDAGPLAILARHSPAEAISHFEAVLAKANSYVGLSGGLRSPLAASTEWVPLLHAMRNRGLLYVGDGLVGTAEDDVPPSATVTLVADEAPFRAAIDARLARLLAAAQRDGSAITYVSPLPVSMERLLAWFDTFPQRGVALAPASAVVRPQP